MDQSLIIYTAIGVFALMITGLGLTIWEFSEGAPKEQARERKERLSRISSEQLT